MATNARGQTTLAGLAVTRASIEGLLMQVNDIRPVANVTARAQMVSDLTAAGFAPSPSRPLYVDRTDAPIGRRTEVNDGAGWRTVTPASGPGSGNANEFGQIAVTHGLGYRPSYCNVTMASAAACGDPAVTESAVRDYTAVVWDMSTTNIVVRFVNRATNGWAGAGARFGVMWSAQ